MAKNKPAPQPSPQPAPAVAQKAPAPAASQPAIEPKAAAKGKSATWQEIADAAYLRWQRFGGDAEQNWLAAERELLGR
jgi:hypothetical protein